MTTYTNVFGGTVVYPSEVSYRAVTLTADTPLSWPTELATDTNVVAQIMDVTANAGPLKLKMPSAIDASVGETTLIFNVGSNDFTVTDTNANTIVSIAPGLAYQIYLTDNTTASGSWRSVQYGAGSSSATAGSLAGQGIKAIGTTLNQSMSVFTFSVNYTLGVASDRSALYVWTGGAGTISLPLASDAGNDWFVQVRNSGTGALTVDPAGVDLINGSSSLVLNPGDSAIIACSGSAWFTIGLGKSASFTFDYNSISLTGQPDPYTLAGANLNRIAYNFGGTLTANFTVIVPTTIQQYWVTNSTSGGFSITVRPAAGAGITVAAGESAILYCDGVNVVDADTSGIAFPISVANGGTGATNATDARTNLSAAKSGVNADITSITALSAGGASGPAVTFAADPDSGMYSAGANQLGFSVNGANAMTLTTSGMSLANALSVTLGAAATPSYTFTGDLNTGFWSPGADILAASTGGSERMRITSAGYVGIGTSAPGFELDVKGAGATTSARIVGGGITTAPASGGTLTIHTLCQGVARTGLDISFTDGAASRLGGFKFTDTQTPGNWVACQMEMVQSYGAANEIVSKLQVEDASWAGMRFVSQTNAGAALATSPTFIWRNYTTEQMRITAAGNVGIGTASPSSKLHVAGALTLDTALSAANGGTGLTSPGTSGNVLTSNGFAWVSSAPSGSANLQEFTSSGTWTKPSGVSFVMVECWGAGGGGGSGQRGAAATNRTGGGGGGGGAYTFRLFKASDLGATETVTIGAGGTGGAARTTDGVSNAGVNGGNTTFGTKLTSYGGGRSGGSTAGAGGGVLSAASASTRGEPVVGGAGAGQFGGANANTPAGFGGAAGASGAIASVEIGACSYQGGAGGGGGGQITSANATSAGTAGGFNAGVSGGGGAGGGSGTGTAGAAGTDIGMAGGGGGSGNTAGTVAGGAGGAGGIAAGGGGGGASTTGANSGAGGKGGDGYCRVYSW